MKTVNKETEDEAEAGEVEATEVEVEGQLAVEGTRTQVLVAPTSRRWSRRTSSTSTVRARPRIFNRDQSRFPGYYS